MRLVTAFPRAVRVIENIWIPLSDGTRLAARVWLPEDADEKPVPALLEYIPYRKRDRTRERDEPMHHYFAGHGYASVRVDLRGTGDSEGLLVDEYHAQEIDDALEVIDFLAQKPWCTGRVGMMGKSWGGFNALQVAEQRPEALSAVITVCASDDRYTDDAHYMGGCLLNENLVWGSALFTLASLPPDPEICGSRWRELWTARLTHLEPFTAEWLRHPNRDDYWKHGSVRENYAAITCPVYAVGGWADAYTNAIPRLLEGLTVPRKGLIGPWAHLYPHNGVPGPAIGFLQEGLRWWDRWLKDADNGVMDEPMLRVWLSDRWVAEQSWPSPNIVRRTFDLAFRESVARVRDLPTVGAASGSWCPFGDEGELAIDQREDDARSFVVDLPALEEDLDILGDPVVRLRLSCDQPRGMLAVRLNDVAPDGSSTRVSYGLLELAHRNGHERAEDLVPHTVYDVTLRLNHTAHRFRAGHVIRLALSGSYWPIAWPARTSFELTVESNAASLELPRRLDHGADTDVNPFGPPESGPPAETVDLHEFVTTTRVEHDPETKETIKTVTTDARPDGTPAMTRIESTDVEHGHAVVERFGMVEGEPASAWAEVRHDVLFRRGDDWHVRVETRHRLSSSTDAFHLEVDLIAREDGQETFRRNFDTTVPR